MAILEDRNARARFIRFQPVKFARNKALRVEVYGVLISRGMLIFI